MTDAPLLRVREADAERDARACADVYAPYVRETAVSFEEHPPDAEEMRRRIERAYVWLVAQHEGRVAGYAYGGPFAQRAAYRWSAETTVYVSASHQRMGAGRALYEELVDRLRSRGLWTLCGGVTQPNAASDGLHRAMGFVEVGTYRRVGFKLGAWRDVRWWQLDLRPGDHGSPQATGHPRTLTSL